MKKMLSVVLGALIVLALSTSLVAASESTSDKQSYGPCWRQSADALLTRRDTVLFTPITLPRTVLVVLALLFSVAAWRDAAIEYWLDADPDTVPKILRSDARIALAASDATHWREYVSAWPAA